MKKVLIYESRKTDGPIAWDASTPELENGAFLELFNLLDQDYGFYSDLQNLQMPEKPLTLKQIEKLPGVGLRQIATRDRESYKEREKDYGRSEYQKELYDKIKSGDSDAARQLLEMRLEYEYEYWSLCQVCSQEA